MRRGSRGVTMLIAIAFLALAGVAVTLVVGLARDDARRTIAERVEAQQRQLLLAGLRDVEARLNAGATPAEGPIVVPAESGETLAIVDVEAPASDRSVVTFASGTLRQRATFARAADGAWRLERAEIVR